MIGITICSPNYLKSGIAMESIRRFMKHTGLACQPLFTHNERNYLAKLQLIKSYNSTIVYFDSDLWFNKDVDLKQFNNKEEFFAVKDCENHPLNCSNWEDTFSYQDCKNLNMDTDKYFNGGLMIFNRKYHADVMDDALHHLRTNPNDFADFGEQSALNCAIQRSDVKLELLPVNYNCMVGGSAELEDICKDPYAVHAAGVPFDRKIEVLTQHTS